jgi:hypothetical protein
MIPYTYHTALFTSSLLLRLFVFIEQKSELDACCFYVLRSAIDMCHFARHVNVRWRHRAAIGRRVRRRLNRPVHVQGEQRAYRATRARASSESLAESKVLRGARAFKRDR